MTQSPPCSGTGAAAGTARAVLGPGPQPQSGPQAAKAATAETSCLMFLLKYCEMCWVKSNTRITLPFLLNTFLGKQSSNNA